MVKMGEKLVYYHKAVQGENGIDVRGKPIVAYRGKILSLFFRFPSFFNASFLLLYLIFFQMSISPQKEMRSMTSTERLNVMKNGSEVVLRNDDMEAYLSLCPPMPGDPYRLSEVMDFLEGRGVTFGI